MKFTVLQLLKHSFENFKYLVEKSYFTYLNGAGVLWVIPSPTSLKDPSGRRDKLGGPTRTGQFPGTAPQPTRGTSEFRG